MNEILYDVFSIFIILYGILAMFSLGFLCGVCWKNNKDCEAEIKERIAKLKEQNQTLEQREKI